jgi:hypothetical protein
VGFKVRLIEAPASTKSMSEGKYLGTNRHESPLLVCSPVVLALLDRYTGCVRAGCRAALKSRNSKRLMYFNPGRKNLLRNGEDRERLRSC